VATNSVSRRCVLCGNDFKLVDHPYWAYFGSNGFGDCCLQCKIVETPKKADVAKLLRAFVDACGFIPKADAYPINYAFTSRLSPDRWPGAMLAYGKMGGTQRVLGTYDESWFRALAESGSLPDGMVTARGIRCIAEDGHMCYSLDEQRLDNWLYAHGLPHRREPFYPFHPTLNPTGKRRADWSVRDTFIEYFGLVGDPKYDKKIDDKVLLASHFKINLVAIYPSQLQNLDETLACLKSLK